MLRVGLLLALLFVPAAVDARCAMYGLVPSVVATSSAVVVGYQDDPGRRLDTGDVAVQTKWRFRHGGQLVTPKIDSLAPGLAVYRLPDRATGTVTLEDASQKTIVTLNAVEKPAGHKPPRAKSVVLSQSMGRRYSASLVVELDGGVPDRAVALVVADAKGKPMSWGAAKAGAASVVVYSQGRCRSLPNGTTAATADQKITLFWVDDTGAKSALSQGHAVTFKKLDDE